MRYSKYLLLFLLLMSYSLIHAQSNPVPSLSALSPSEVPAGQETLVTLTGTGFGERMRVNLSGVGFVPRTFIDANTITIRIPANLSAGSYSVTVIKRDGSTSNALDLLVVGETVPSPAPGPSVTSVEPQRILQGTEATISIFGSGFSSDLLVRLQGYGLIPTSFVNNAVLTAEIPSSLPARETYFIELIAGNGSFYPTTASIRIVAPAEPSPVPTEPLPTEMPLPTEIPEQANIAPFLQLSGFTVNPATVDAGQSATVNFTVTNRGNDTARMITVNFNSSDAFVPATGQVAVMLPDLVPGATASGQLTVTASLGIAAGPSSLGLVIDYQNPMGESFSSNAELSLMVNAAPSNSQLIIDAYVIEPSPSAAGEVVRLQLTLFNIGDSAVTQVLLHIGDGVLIPQGRGDAIPVGDIEGRQTAPVELSMLVNSSAEAGYQMQTISISYYQNGESYEVTSNIMVDVVSRSHPQPLLLLSSYQSDVENLQPGSRFNLSIELENAGAAPAHSTLISFGTVQAEPSENAGSGGTDLSAAFAPLGSAGLDFIGDIEAGATISSSQEFIVSGNLASGIYSLPVSLQYTLPDGTNKSETLYISLVVIAPPQLQFSPQQAVPETVYAGEFVSVTIEIGNNGNDVNLEEAVFTAENGEVVDGASIELDSLKEGSETSIEALIIPSEAGVMTVTLTLHYKDELNQAQSIVVTYTSLVQDAPPVENVSLEEAIVYDEEVPLEEQSDPNWFGRVMMAFFGLGS